MANLGPVLKVFIGWDSREPIAFSVLSDSILRHASIPVAITPLCRKGLGRLYTRKRGPTESTEFSLTRFLCPFLSGYHGLSLFMDSDMLCQADLLELTMHVLADPGKALYVCPHDYTPANATKFLGQVQTAYPRKNQSSFMLFANAQCQALTPEYVNTASGLDLHRFHWLRDGVTPTGLHYANHDEADYIGELPLEWNHLVGEYEPNEDAKCLHWTLGGPWLSGYEDVEHAGRWFAARDQMLGLPVAVPA